MGYIYKITNLKTGKMYVGQTQLTIAERWKEHLHRAKYDYKLLYQVMRKCGVENFIIEEIEECPNDKLDEREMYWIAKLETHGKGYNMTDGGDTFRKYTISQVEINQWWQDFCNGISIAKISKMTGYSEQLITARISNHKSYKKIAKRNLQGNKKPYTQLRKYRRNIFIYDLNGKLLERTLLSRYSIDVCDEIIECATGRKKSYDNKLYSYAYLPPYDITNMYQRFLERRANKQPLYDLILLYKIRNLNKWEK